MQHLGFNPENEVLVTVTFSLLDGAKDLVLSLPWTIYGEACGWHLLPELHATWSQAIHSGRNKAANSHLHSATVLVCARTSRT